jgi:hypothetical protein
VTIASAQLEEALLDGAVADEHTSWPNGFDWRAAGVIVTGEGIMKIKGRWLAAQEVISDARYGRGST